MKILVLSDLHIGHTARGKDLCPYHDNVRCLDENYQQDFIDFIQSEHIEVDYIAITGDISDKAAVDEFELANNFINSIAKVLHIPSKKVLIVPGNHDVDWSLYSPTTSESQLKLRKQQRYDPIKSAIKYELNTFDNPYFTIWEFEDLFVLGYNSAWHDDKMALLHNGTVTDEIIHQMDSAIKSKSLEDKNKLFITHHHLFQYSDIGAVTPDTSIMHNAENLLTMLAQNKFDMIIHGHKHIPHIKTFQLCSIHPIAMLCAGSFSVILDQRLNGCVLNMFHIVNFEGRDRDTEVGYGVVENYSFCSPHKWFKSQKNNSTVLYKHGFGSYDFIPRLKKELIPEIEIKIKDQGCVLWSSLCKDNRKLSYHTPDFIDTLTSEIAEELSLKRFSTDDEIIFTSL